MKRRKMQGYPQRKRLVRPQALWLYSDFNVKLELLPNMYMYTVHCTLYTVHCTLYTVHVHCQK